jgi:hypothetical protein
MESKSKNITVCVIKSRKAPDVAVVMTIEFSCGDFGMQKLKANNPPQDLYKGAESAALAFSIFECVRDKLVGSPLALAQSKVSSVCCGTSSGTFTICWNTKGTISSVRSTIVKVVSCLAPWKQYARYSDNIRLLRGSPDRGEFNKQASDFAAALKKNIFFDVVGKLGAHTKAHLNVILAKAHAKMPAQSASKPLKAPTAHPVAEFDYPSVSVKGFNAILAAEYIRSNSGGMGVMKCPDKIYVLNKAWESKKKQLAKKARVSTYVAQKYSKLKTDMSSVLAYLVASKCSGDHSSIKMAAKSTASDITKRICETLK